ncbi:glycosyltransferase [Sphingobacterium griseoflavum]|uniref:Glycosyl transferase family 1 n=1 Tax=Sphingobacterium griseoflavum TaxID=1474952 RepID=A0ABQ3HVW4_9SPHI|nr:glycosyltransferase [Sphingobacterium griseoflavum]GHE39763.1 glycosyl transferase family 1 [Sphingobacterium griseoflavum]
MKVLHIVTRIDSGGISTFLYNYYQFLDRSSVQFDIVAIDTGTRQAYHDIFESLGVRVFYMPDPIVQRLVFLAKLIRSHRYDIVHAHIELQSSVYLAVAALFGVRGRVAHAHLSMARSGLKNRLLRTLMNLVVSARVGASDLSIHAVFGKRYAKKAIILYNAVNLDKFGFRKPIRDTQREKLKLMDKFVLGFVGRLSIQKNVFFLLDVFALVLKQKSDTILLLVGDGELRTEMELRINQMDISENVIFLSNRDDIPELMMAMDVLLLPSFYEGLPLVLVEAQAAALKSLVSNNVTKLVGITEFIQYEAIDNAQLWCDIILSEFVDYPRYSVENIITANRFNIREEANRLSDFYNGLINR